MTYPTTRLSWNPAYRVIPSRFPSICLFERVASPADFDALYALEAMTNDRIILADEPVGSVNPVLAHDLFGHVRNLTHHLGITFVMIEHRLQIATGYADYVYAMMDGKIVSQGDSDHVLGDAKVIEGYLQ